MDGKIRNLEELLEEERKIEQLKFSLAKVLKVATKTDKQQKGWFGNWEEYCFSIEMIPEELRSFLKIKKRAVCGEIAVAISNLDEKTCFYTRDWRFCEDMVYVMCKQNR